MEQDSILSPRIGALDAPPKGSIQEMAEFGDIWNHCKRKMVIIGSATPGLLGTEDVALLAADPSVLVFTETTSNCHHPNFFPSIDSIVAPIEKSKDKETLFERLQPELLITMGGMVVSKKIKAFLRAYRPKHHWHIDSRRCYDTYFSLTRHFRCTPDEFFREFKPCIHTGDSNYREQWEEVRERYRLKRKEYLGQIEFSDMLVFYHIQTTIPQNNYVQLANSSTVRYSQLFEMHPSLKVFCNRGTSGIDGSTSTAVGASLLVESPTVLISGDLSFLYDSNGLWNNYLRPDFRIILINNKGGGIFRILPGAEESDTFETFFETTQDLDISKLCDFYGLEHFTAANETQLSVILSRFYEPSEQPRLLEVQTPRVVNNKILLTYFDFLS